MLETFNDFGYLSSYGLFFNLRLLNYCNHLAIKENECIVAVMLSRSDGNIKLVVHFVSTLNMSTCMILLVGYCIFDVVILLFAGHNT